MKKLFFVIVAVFLIMSCQKFQTDGKENDKTVKVANEDTTMNSLIEEARATSHVFFEQMQKKENDERDFSVKYPFETDPGSKESTEHIWLINIKIKDGTYYGTISNEPYHIKKLKMMDIVAFDPTKISDWKYIKNDYLVGGKSIVYLIRNLSKEERKELLKQVNFKIKEFENEEWTK